MSTRIYTLAGDVEPDERAEAELVYRQRPVVDLADPRLPAMTKAVGAVVDEYGLVNVMGFVGAILRKLARAARENAVREDTLAAVGHALAAEDMFRLADELVSRLLRSVDGTHIQCRKEPDQS